MPWPPIAHRRCACVGRGSAAARRAPFLSRLVDSLPGECVGEAQAEYLALLDRALLDRLISVREQGALVACARDLAIDQPTALGLHRTYLHSHARAAWADGVVSEPEREDLLAVAALLDLDPAEVTGALAAAEGSGAAERGSANQDQGEEGCPAGAAPSSANFGAGVNHFRLQPGDLVVFTGQLAEPREVWVERAVAAGLVPHPGVTKKVRLVVAADPDSLSGKARKAVDYGIPIVTEAAFASMVGSV